RDDLVTGVQTCALPISTGISSGVFGLRDVLASPVPTPIDRTPAPPGAYDNVDPRIEYTGAWLDDHQFSRAADGSLTYSNVPGNKIGRASCRERVKTRMQ